jgi:hypothetical protein
LAHGEFPILPKSVVLPGKIIHFSTYFDAAKDIAEMGLTEYGQSHAAFIVQRISGDFYIYYNSDLGTEQIMFALAHELGHVALEHSVIGLTCGKEILTTARSSQEAETDYFALCLLAPPCVLFAAGIRDAREISLVTGLSLDHSRAALDEAKRLRGQALSEAERRLCEKFLPFIRERKAAHRSQYKRPIIAAAIFIALAVIAFAIKIMESPPPRTYDIRLEATPATSTAPIEDVRQVYVTRSGNRFHREDCYYIEGRATTAMTIDEAIRNGYGACQVCRPLGA